LSDIKRLAGSFFGKPVINYLKIFFLFHISRLTGNVFTASFPFAFSAEVSSMCNLGCPGCMVGMGKTVREKHFMDILIFEKLLNETRRRSFYVNLYFQGEPFLNKNIFDFISKAKSKRFYTVVSTNGHFLDEKNNEELIRSGLDRLVVSIDGIRAETYSHYRKAGDFFKVIKGIKNLTQQKKVTKKKHPFIVLQFLVHRNNEHELKDLKSFAGQLGVDMVKLKSMQFHTPESMEKLSPSNEKYRRYRQNTDGTWHVKSNGQKPCFRIWSQFVITSDGDVVPCCYDKIPQHVAGNINEGSITEIWKSKKLNALRKNLINNKNLPGICYNCYS